MVVTTAKITGLTVGVPVNTLTHYNGVVDDDTQHQQESKRRHDVERDIVGRQQGEGAQE